MGRDFKSEKEKKKDGVKKESDLMKFLKKRSFIYIGIIVFTIGMFGSGYLTTDLIDKSFDALSDEDRKIAKQVTSYKGTDDDGRTMLETIRYNINDKYSNEKIFGKKDTSVSLQVIDGAKSNLHEVHFSFITHKENSEYIWQLDTDSGEITALNKKAKTILNTVDNYD